MDVETPSTSDAWHTHLSAQGGEFETPHRISFNAAADAGATSVMPLVQMAVVEIDGPDSEKFLQGQTSAQVAQADGRIAPPTCFCTPKGRMIANAQLLRVAPERYWLLLEASVAAALRAHLAKYAVFYKTELRLRDDLAIIGVAGPEAASALESLEAEPPAQAWSMTRSEALVVTRHPGEPSRFVAIGEAAPLIARWEALTRRATVAGNAHWTLLDIRAGLAWIDESRREALLPQMINWEALGGISFKKGCYTGQEVVARAHYRGQVKKRLMRFRLADERAAAGDTVALSAPDGKALGDIVALAPAPEGGVELLAVVTQREEMPPLRLGDTPVEALPLPYPLERLDPESFASA